MKQFCIIQIPLIIVDNRDRRIKIENEKTWGHELRIALPRPSVEVLNRMAFPENMNFNKFIERGDFLEINNNTYVWNLFKMGFTLGSNERNIEKIAAHIPEDVREYFYQGVNLG